MGALCTIWFFLIPGPGIKKNQIQNNLFYCRFLPLIEKPFARAASNARSSIWAITNFQKHFRDWNYSRFELPGKRLPEWTDGEGYAQAWRSLYIYILYSVVDSFTLWGGKIVFYKTDFPLNKIGFVICDKCNEEFYAPKVDFSDESYGQKRHSCSYYDYDY